MVKNLFQRVADEACPPAVLGRRMCGSSRFDKWGFESPTQFYVVVIPGQAEPELSCLVDKSDGKHTHLAFVIGVCLTNSVVMVCG